MLHHHLLRSYAQKKLLNLKKYKYGHVLFIYSSLVNRKCKNACNKRKEKTRNREPSLYSFKFKSF